MSYGPVNPFKRHREQKDHRGNSIKWWHSYDKNWSRSSWYDYGWYGGYVIASVVLVIGLIVGLCLAIIPPAVKGYDERQCARYSSASGFETKFEDYSYWTWQCYVRYQDRWVTSEDFNHLFVVQGIGD